MHAIKKSRKEGERWTWEKARGFNAGARPLFRLPGKIQSRNLPMPAAYFRECPAQKIKITKRTHFAIRNYPITTITYARDVQGRKEKRTHLAPHFSTPKLPFPVVPTHSNPCFAYPIRCSAFSVRCSSPTALRISQIKPIQT